MAGTSIFDTAAAVMGNAAPAKASNSSGSSTQTNPASFVQQYAPLAQSVGERLGVDPSTILGQWGLETGWGKSVIPGTNNLGNIKDFSNKGPVARDNQTGSQDSYKSYADENDFADGFSSLIGGSSRYKAALDTGADAGAYFKALKAGGYAQDPDYVKKGVAAADMASRLMTGKDPASGKYYDGPRSNSIGAAPEKPKATIGDYAKELGASAIDSAGFIGQAAGEIGAYGMNKLTGTEDYEGKNVFKPVTDALRESKTDGGKQASEDGNIKGSVIDLLNGDADLPKNLDGWVMMGANGFGSMLPMLIPGLGMGSRVASLSKAAKVAELAGDAAEAARLAKAASSASMAAKAVSATLEGGMTGGAAANDVRNSAQATVDTMTHEQLMEKVPAYAESFNETGDQKTARNAVVNGAARWAGGLSAIAGAAGGVMNQKVLEDFLVHKGVASIIGNNIGSRTGRALVAGAGGSLAEGAQETSEKMGQNAGENIGLGKDATDNIMRDTAGDFLGGVVVGGPTGFVGGAFTKGKTHTNPIAEQAKEPGSVLSRTALIGNPQLQEQLDPFTKAANDIATQVSQGGLLDKLRNIGQPQTVTEFLDALTQAKNPNMPDSVRQQAVDSLHMAMGWIADGKMPNEPGNGRPYSTDLTTQPAPVQPGTSLAPTRGGELTTPGMPKAFDPNTVDGEVTRVDNMIEGPKALPAPPGMPLATINQNPANAGFSASGAPVLSTTEKANGTQTTEAQQAEAQGQEESSPAAVAPAAPRATAMLTAPRTRAPMPIVKIAPGQGTAQIRKFKAQAKSLIASGFDTVEQRGGAFYAVNHGTNTETKLEGPAAAQVMRVAIKQKIDADAHVAPSSPLNDKREPTPGQIEAGNYEKPVVMLNGLKLRIENAAGSKRRGVSPEGKKWESTMVHHYGEIEGTRGADGDKIDAFIGNRPDSDKIYVVDQKNADGTFDEHKVMLGFTSMEAARQGYLDNYEKGWTGLAGITEMSVPDFKAWIKTPASINPLSSYAFTPKTGVENVTGKSETSERQGQEGLGENVSAPAPSADGRGDSGIQEAVAGNESKLESAREKLAQHKADLQAQLDKEKDPQKRAALQFEIDRTPNLNTPAADELSAFAAITSSWTAQFGTDKVAAYFDPGMRASDGFQMGDVFYVNLSKPQMAIQWTVGHEFEHVMDVMSEGSALAPDQALQRLRSLLWSQVTEAGKKKFFEGFLFKGESYKDATPEQLALLKKEMLAEFMGARFADREWLENLAKQKPALFGSFIREWLKTLDNIIKSLRSAVGLDEDHVKRVDKYMKDLAEAKAIAMDIADNWARRNPKLAATTGAAESIKMAHSFRIDMDFMDAEMQRMAQEEMEQESASEAAKPTGKTLNTSSGVSDEAVKSAGFMAEAAYPELHWEKPKDNDYQFVANVPGLYAEGQNGRITLDEEPGTGGLWGATMRQTWVGPAANESIGWTTLQAAKDFARRFVASKDLVKRKFDLADTVDKDTAASLVKQWSDINASAPKKYKETSGKEKAIKDIAGEMGILENYQLDVQREPVDQTHSVVNLDFRSKKDDSIESAQFDITLVGKKRYITIHASMLNRGGLGAAVYQLISEYAAKTDMQIVPDDSLSGVNTYRRTEQMLSAALRTGKSNIMVPHATQRLYGFDRNADTQEAHDANIARMLLAGLRNVLELAPGVKDIRYVPITGKFVTSSGADADGMVKAMLSDKDARAFGLGRSTIARAALTQQMLEGSINPEKMVRFNEPVLYSARDQAELEYKLVDEKYRGTPDWMMAPDGTRSKLRERQWIQVRTPSFKNWFGDWEQAHKDGGVWSTSLSVSKAVDANGEPVVVYHGTDTGGFFAFNTPGGTKRGDIGIFTTSNENMADSYVRKGRATDFSPPTTKSDLEGMGYDLNEEDEGKWSVMEPDGYNLDGPRENDFKFASEEDAVKAALESFAGTDDVHTVYAAFINLRNPNETDFEGAMWGGERPGQWQVFVDPDEAYADPSTGKQYFTEDEARAIAKGFAAPEDEDEGSNYVRPADDHYEDTDGAAREGRKNGHDGTIIRNVVDDGGGRSSYSFDPSDLYVANDPSQLKSADWNTGEFGPGDDLRFSQRAKDLDDFANMLEVSTTVPSAKRNGERIVDPVREKWVIDSQDIISSSSHLEAVKAAISLYNAVDMNGKSDAIKVMHERMVENLVWLHDLVPAEVRARAKLWYDGANKIAYGFADKFSIDPRQAAGVLAALSPQKDWFMNTSLAERVITIVQRHGEEPFSHDMVNWARSYIAASKTVDERGKRQKFLDAAIRLEGTKLVDMDYKDAAMFVRIFDETYFPRQYRVVTPEGGFGEYVSNASDEVDESSDETEPGQIAWGALDTIEKGIRILRDKNPGTIIRTVSENMGEMHKVRNFYNNIISPNSTDGHVTIDTHAIAAAFVKALSGSSIEVLHNFGSTKPGIVGAGANAKTGATGIYGLVADAYREAAAKVGILAREMQSITWEAIRSIFQPTFKSNHAKDIEAMYDRYQAGEMSLDEARQMAYEMAGGMKEMAWEGTPQGIPVQEGGESFDSAVDEYPGLRKVRLLEPVDAKDKIMVSLSAATSSIPGIRALHERANNGDVYAHQLIQDIALDNLAHLLQGTSAKVKSDRATGLYGGSAEPALSLSITFKDSDRARVLAGLAKFADNFNQEQVHVRQGTKQKIGTKFDDGSYVTPVYRWDLNQSLSQNDIQKIINESGLYGLTFGSDFVEAYFVGDTDDAEGIKQFKDGAKNVTTSIGGRSSGNSAAHARFWPYGRGEGAIGYERIRGDVPAGPSAPSKTAKRVAAYISGVDQEKLTTFKQAKSLTKKQDQLQTEIAQVYESLPDNDLKNPRVRKAYVEATKELKKQFEALPVKVEMMIGNGEPYRSSDHMRQDLLDNNHLFIFATDKDTFGSEGSDFTGHPLLEQSSINDANGNPMTYNDLLRAVHDYFAHAIAPVTFGPLGEEAAWKAHMSMTMNPWARWAITSETRGQNSWVNFNAGLDRSTPVKDRPFARQKVVLIPAKYMLTGDPSVDALTQAFIEKLPEKQRGGSKPMYSSRDTWYYSELANKIGEASMKQAPAGAWKSYINALTQKGVKPDEITWSGVEDWLDLQAQPQPIYEPGFALIEEHKNNAGNWVQVDDIGSYFKTKEEAESNITDELRNATSEFAAKNGTEGRITVTPVNGLYFGKTSTAKITKEQIQEYLKGNGVDVKEVTLGGENQTPKELKYYVEYYGGDLTTVDGLRETARDANIDANRAEKRGDTIKAANFRKVAELAQSMADSGTTGTEPTKYHSYTLPGGENYREVLLTLPTSFETKSKALEPEIRELGLKQDLADISPRDLKDAGASNDLVNRFHEAMSGSAEGSYHSSHWTQPNILAHIRLDDRADADGNRVLFVEEVQSDWGQDGKKNGFFGELKGEAKEYAELSKQFEAGTLPENKYDRFYALQDSLGGGVQAEQTKGGVPAAPFVTKTEGWLNLALKRIIAMAVDGGYDKVAFVNGEQSADRYDLSKQVSALSVEREADGKTYNIGIDLMSGGSQKRNGTPEEELEGLVGKEMAAKLKDAADKKDVARAEYRSAVKNDAPESEQKEKWEALQNVQTRFSGLDLKVGGEGMKTFYDKIVPNAMNALLKKTGGGKLESIEILDAAKPKTPSAGAELDAEVDSILNDAFGDSQTPPRLKDGTLSQPGFTIAPEMVKKLENGLPLFSERQQDGGEKQPKKADKFAGKSVAVPVKIEETGEVATLIMDVNQTLDDYAERKANMQKLLECL